MAGNLPASQPAPLARAAMERVLARAAELQARDGDDDGGALSEAQLIELAKEVGLSPDNVRQALAEERARVDVAVETGAAYAMLGAATVHAARTVPGDPAGVLAALDHWMQRTESLQVKRRFPDQLSWEPRQDFVSTIRRALRIGGRAFHLALATDVHGVAASAGPQRTHVRIVANFAAARARRSGAAFAAATAGVVVGVPLFWMATNAGLMVAAGLSIIPALGVPAAAFSLVRSQYHGLLARAQVSLEQALDRLEYGDAPRRGP